MKLSFDLTESQNQKLDAAANRLGIPREELAKAALDRAARQAGSGVRCFSRVCIE